MEIKKFATFKYILFVLGVGLILFFIWINKDITLLFFTSFIIASAINPAVDTLNKKMPRWLAVLIIYLIGFIVVGLILIPLMDVAIKQTIVFINLLPEYWAKASSLTGQIQILSKHIGFVPDFSNMVNSTATFSQDIINRSINLTVSLVEGLIITFTLAMIVLYMLLDKESIKKTYLRFFPQDMRLKAEQISANISKKVGGYVIGQLFSMVAVAIVTTVGLSILGIKFAILLGFIAGILDIIPVVGPLVAAVPGILIALYQDPILALWAILVYVIAQWVTNTFARPLIFSKFLDLHPLVIIFSILVAANLLGVIGVIIAPAIAAMVCVLMEELYLKQLD